MTADNDQKADALAIVSQLYNLDPYQRAQARTDACEAIKARYKMPTRADYLAETISEYPQWLQRGMLGMMLVLLTATAIPSFFRMFHAGRTYFLHGINDHVQATLVGFAVFIMAETTLISASIAREVLFKGQRAKRAILMVVMLMAFALAIVGNWTVANPESLFGLLETITPPVATLAIAMVLEGLALSSLKNRLANERAFQQALAEYRRVTDNPEHDSNWKQIYGQYLKLHIERVNTVGRGATDRGRLMAGATPLVWSLLIAREKWLEGKSYDDVDVSDDDLQAMGAGTPRPALKSSVQTVQTVQSVQIVQNGQTVHTGQTERVTQTTPRTPKIEMVLRHLENNPDDAQLSSRALADKIGNVGHTNCSQALSIFKQSGEK
jgi:hypothetical protein